MVGGASKFSEGRAGKEETLEVKSAEAPPDEATEGPPRLIGELGDECGGEVAHTPRGSPPSVLLLTGTPPPDSSGSTSFFFSYFASPCPHPSLVRFGGGLSFGASSFPFSGGGGGARLPVTGSFANSWPTTLGGSAIPSFAIRRFATGLGRGEACVHAPPPTPLPLPLPLPLPFCRSLEVCSLQFLAGKSQPPPRPSIPPTKYLLRVSDTCGQQLREQEMREEKTRLKPRMRQSCAAASSGKMHCQAKAAGGRPRLAKVSRSSTVGTPDSVKNDTIKNVHAVRIVRRLTCANSTVLTPPIPPISTASSPFQPTEILFPNSSRISSDSLPNFFRFQPFSSDYSEFGTQIPAGRNAIFRLASESRNLGISQNLAGAPAGWSEDPVTPYRP